MSGDVQRSPRRLFLAADETTVVADTDTRAAFLLVAPGQPIPAGYEIPDELLEPLPEEPAPGGLTLVGELGPELVTLPDGEVHTVKIGGTPPADETPAAEAEKVAPDAAAAAEKATPKPKAKPKPKAPADTTTPATPEE